MAIPRTATTSISLVLALTVAALLAIAAPAIAQNPGADQYTPTAPSGGGPVPSTGNHSPEPSSAPDSSDDGSDDGSVAPVTSAPPSDPGSTDTPPAAATGNDDAKHQKAKDDKHALDGIAAAAKQDRKADQGSNSVRLLRDDDGDSGPSLLLWIVIGASLLWAILMAVARRRRGGNEPPSGGSGARSTESRNPA